MMNKRKQAIEVARMIATTAIWAWKYMRDKKERKNDISNY